MQRDDDFMLKETNPQLGGVKATSDKLTSNYDLVEKMEYLYVRIFEARDLPVKKATGSYVEIRLGDYKGTTFLSEKKSDSQWFQVFAFSVDHVRATVLEATVKSTKATKQDFVGRLLFDLNVVPPNTPLPPQWYRLQDGKGKTSKGELMLAVWWGTQADKAFHDAWHSDGAITFGAEGHGRIGSKVYLSPKLWYLRVNVIQAEGLMATDKTIVKAILGNQILRTRDCTRESTYLLWNEDLMFVAAEPFEEPLILSVENRVATDKAEVLGRCAISLQYVDRRLDRKPQIVRWYNVEKSAMITEGGKKETKFARLYIRICFEGGYHVFDEATHNSSDFRPSGEQLWKSNVGVLEVGIINARNLLPMKTIDGRPTTDAYCVAKYGQKWIRTRTIMDSFTPSWNERSVKDLKIGKPLLPKMHYNYPLPVKQIESLRHQAVQIISRKLSCVEPPLRKEVVEYILEVDYHMWNLRSSKAIFFRIMGVLSGLFAAGKWFEEICNWKNPRNTILIQILFLTWVVYPVLILPTIFFYLFLVGVSLYRWRPKHPPHLDTRLSQAESVHPDELDEEFDTFPTSRSIDLVMMRYDRLRSIAGRILHVGGDLAVVGERLQSLLSWRDPRATVLIVTSCLIAAIVLYVAPFPVALLTVFYVLRHPRLRHKHPIFPYLLLNFFMRLPSRKDSMLLL
ncbi:hypothetical protein AgCh_034582 [Apium graveolens]